MNKVKLINKLKQRKYRDELGLFIVEGDKLVSEIPKDLLEFVISVDEIGERDFNKLSELTTPQKFIAVCKKPDNLIMNYEFGGEKATEKQEDNSVANNSSFLIPHSSLIIALDRIQDPNNVGAILRSTAAAGLKNVILLEGTADPFNLKSVRASMGAIFHLNLIDMTEEELINSNLNLVSAHMKGKSYRDFKMSDNSALIFGNEGAGVSKNLLEVSEKITIPIHNVESLNVNAAAAILIFQFA